MNRIFVTIFLALGIFLSASGAEAATLSPAPSASGLVGYWSFNEGTSTKAADFSGNGNTGTLTNMDATTDWVAGKLGKGLDFDGTNDYVDFGTGNLVTPSADFTMSAWARLDTFTSGNGYIFIKGDDSTGNSYGINFSNSSGIKPLFMVRANGASVSTFAVMSTAVSAGQWHHIVGVKTGLNISLYVNGVLVAGPTSITGGNLTTSSGSIRVGNQNRSGSGGGCVGSCSYPLDGAVDDVRLYSRALTAAEITQLYGAGAVQRKVVSQNGLAGHWRFDEGTLTRANDSSGNGNTGTLTNMDSATGWVAGKFGKALDFDGTNDYVTFPDTNTLDIGQGASATISVWYYSQNNTSERFIYSKRSTDASTATDYLLLTTGNQLIFGTGSSADSCAWQTVTEPSKNSWHHVVGVISSTGAQTGTKMLYIDGALVDSCNYSIKTASNSASLYVGRPVASSSYWTGKIDDFRIYNRALSAAEVSTLYASGAATRKQVSDSGLVGHWSFNEGTSTRAADFSGNGNIGTLTNMDATTDWVAGKIAKALDFDGSNDYVLSSASLSSISNNRTVSVWVKVRGSGTRGILNTRSSVSSNGYVMRIDASNQLDVFHTGGLTMLDTAFSQYVGQWTHIAWVQSSDTGGKVYINGIQAASTASNTSSVDGGVPLRIGVEDSALTSPFDGIIDDVRIYNRALSTAEIQTLYDLGR